MTARAARLTVVAGLLVMIVAGIVASRYTPFWFDPDEGCALLGRCATAAADVVLRLMWWAVAAGLAIVGLGLVAAWRTLPAPPAPVRPLPAPVRAIAAGVIGLVLCTVLGWGVLLAALFAAHLVPAALCVLWLVQARTVLAVDRVAAPAHRSAGRRWVGALAASALAVAAMACLADGPVDGRLLPVVDAVVLASTLLLDGVLPVRRERVGVPRLGAAVLAVLVVGAATGYLVLDRPYQAPVTAPVAQPPPAPSPVPSPAPAHAPVPPPPVDASIACTPDDLVWATTGWDAAMGTRAVTVVATHDGPGPCYVDGFASITLSQGGRALQLTVEPGSVAEPGSPVTAARVGIAPGGSAYFGLLWKGYGAAADEESPQSLSVVLPGAASPSDVPLSGGPAPFDLVDGGTVVVGPWQPGPA
ncbi:hypothetical protein GCM10009609_56140 [Pseudonocardia aurantiaca]|uniref:DUF4232 domain-containing protein n=1 Tax=Pseudonocardia aurantiaca TaxID=75290 RepID=A0ABW4FYE1_9PSEU